MWYELLLWPFVAALLLCSTTAPIGCFMLWRNMAFIGETLAHSALLGVALGLLFDAYSWGWVAAVCIIIGIIINHFQQRRDIGDDTVLGVFAHGSLALGLIVFSLAPQGQAPSSYLFGDILAITQQDCIWIALLSLSTAILLRWLWKPLLLTTIDEELALSQHIPVYRLKLVTIVLLALVIAVGMKLVGLLLLTALMIIPAAAARLISQTPLQMVLYSGVYACCANLLGFTTSFFWDIPTGASIVATAMLFFLITALYKKISD